MTTNIFLGFPFGFISVSMHCLLLFIDPRKSYRFYNMSLFIWVSANFIWMMLEFLCTRPSSDIHIGPQTPLGGIDDHTQTILVNVKTIMFFVAALIQVLMYVLIYFQKIEMPEDEDETLSAKNELHFLLGRPFRLTSRQGSDLLRSDSDAESPAYQVSLAFVENAYIIFWISKDLFWSW